MTDDSGTRVEQVTPYGEGAKTEQVRQMFDAIAPAYDFMNRAMTLGIDIWWRQLAVKRLKRLKPATILDVATGTGDFAIQLNDSLQPQHITGIDLSEGMLAEARRKVKKKGLEDVITFKQDDCMALHMDDATVDAVTVAFGVRNFEHLQQGYQEMARVLKPGGRHAVRAGTVHAHQSADTLVLRPLHAAHHSLAGLPQERREECLPIPTREHSSRSAG